MYIISPRVFTKNELKIIVKTSLEKLKLYISKYSLTEKLINEVRIEEQKNHKPSKTKIVDVNPTILII